MWTLWRSLNFVVVVVFKSGETDIDEFKWDFITFQTFSFFFFYSAEPGSCWSTRG